MPPFSRHGQPVEQRIRPRPSTLTRQVIAENSHEHSSSSSFSSSSSSSSSSSGHSEASLDVPYTHERIGDSELLRFESELNSRRKATLDSNGLVFLQPPQLTDTDSPPLVSSVKNIQLSDLNSGPRSASRYKNDGCPPDTIKTLLRQRLKKKRGTSRQNLHALSVGT